MLNSDIAAFREDLLARDKASIIEIAVENYSIRSDMEARLHVMEQISRDMSLQYDEMRNLLKCREYEIEELRKQNLHLAGVRTMQAQEMYGQSSEKIVSIINERSRSKFEDPLSEDAEGSEQPEEVHTLGKVVSFGRTHKSGKGRRTTDTSSLPEVTYYDYDIEKLNEQFGEGNWRFFSWDRHETREIQRRYAYRKVTYTPVISYGLEHMLYRMPYEGSIIPKSSVSSSLLASILSDYANMHMPLFRMEHDTDRYGFPISRQTMSRWMMKVAEDLFAPVLGCMKRYLDSCTYQQGDETTYQVVMDKSHIKNYVWVHRTSELSGTVQVIIYCFELSRGAAHLFDFYKDHEGPLYLTSDAYGAYSSLELHDPEKVTVCGCFMHARRRWVDSLRSLHADEKAELEALPEMKAIRILTKLYDEEGELRELSAEDRYEKRQEKVAPVVDEYFNYVNSLDDTNPLYSDKLKDAIRYSKNQETYLRRFLEDGNIPVDNGASERNMKPVACHRKNSLF
ncbi:MAG: IS66 family transposase, partial [Lachnospiraceae bacterium]|nr:IS66 family transposase [Lachnospiraceae bacterium]